MKKNQDNELPNLQNHITLLKLFEILSKSKVFIIAFTLSMTLAIIIYSNNRIQEPTEFNSTLLVKIGDYKDITYKDYHYPLQLYSRNNKNSIGMMAMVVFKGCPILSGEHILLESPGDLVYELNMKFLDIKGLITSIESKEDLVSGENIIIEIKSTSSVKEESVHALQKVVDYIQSKHNDIISELKKKDSEEIDIIAKGKNSHLLSIQKSIDFIEKSQIAMVDEKIRLINSIISEDDENLNSINYMFQILDLKNDKAMFEDDLRTLGEAKATIEYQFKEHRCIHQSLLNEMYSNSTIVGETVTNQVQATLFNKYLLIIIGFMSSLILACFAVLIIDGLRSQKKITTG